MKGTVKWFSNMRGYGFIQGEDKQRYFVHYSMIQGEGFRSLLPETVVVFDPVESNQGRQALNVRPPAPEDASPVPPASSPRRLKLNPFTPQDPITDPHKFAGRDEPLVNAIDCLFNNKNLLVVGARGIGKSSVAYQLINLTRGDRTLIDRIRIDTGGFEFNHITGDHRCLPGNTLEAVIRGLLGSVRLSDNATSLSSASTTKHEWDFKIYKRTTETSEASIALEESVLSFVAATEATLTNAPEGTTGICYLIDEIDVLDSSVQLAPFLKAVTEKLRLDRFGNISFVLSGVSGSVTELIAQHPSAARLTEILSLAPMDSEELAAVIENCLSETGVSIADDAKAMIIDLSGNFPAPVHLLGYHSFKFDSDGLIDVVDVARARDFVVMEIKQQDFQGRLDRVGGGVAANILRILAEGRPEDMTAVNIAKQLGERVDTVAGLLHDRRQLGDFVHKKGARYDIAEPLFKIYLRWVLGIDEPRSERKRGG